MGLLQATQQRTKLALIGLLALLFAAAAGGLAVRFWRADAPVPTAHLVPVVQEASVAVLPFVDMSGDPEKAYFGDGLSEELRDDLAKAPDLRVASRTTSAAFEGRNANIPDIARRLHVRTVLEGSVREDGKRVRITAQLINAADGFHLWSQTYDRELADVLSTQDEIVRAIRRALTDRPPNDGPKPKRIDPGVYRKYLEARYYLRQGSPSGLQRAADLAGDVTKADPDFVPGFAILGHTRLLLAGTDQRALDDAAGPLDRALVLDPANSEARLAHLRLSLLRWDWRSAARDADRLLAWSRNNAEALLGLAFYYRHLGFPEKARELSAAAVTRDPPSRFRERAQYAGPPRTSPVGPALVYVRTGNLDKAMELFERCYDTKDVSLMRVPYDPATPRTLVDDPRWKALWQKPELKAWQDEHDRMAKTLAVR